jgi:hypothetical protein
MVSGGSPGRWHGFVPSLRAPLLVQLASPASYSTLLRHHELALLRLRWGDLFRLSCATFSPQPGVFILAALPLALNGPGPWGSGHLWAGAPHKPSDPSSHVARL